MCALPCPTPAMDGPCARCYEPFACGVAMPGIWSSGDDDDGNYTRWFCVTCARLLENNLQGLPPLAKRLRRLKPLVALAERLQAQGPAQVAAPAA